MKLVRFALIGALTGCTYALTTLSLYRGLGIPMLWASIMGYLAILPFSFLGHKKFTFRSNGKYSREFFRFAISFLFGLSVTIVIVMIVEKNHFNDLYAIILPILIVPISNFILSNLWVFRNQS